MNTQQNVNVSNIESELRRLHDSQANARKTKACLFNLIIYTREPRRTPYFQEMVHKIIEQFPCRIIFIQGNRSSKDSYLRLQASIASSDQGFACDQITIEVSNDQLSRVPFLILPLFAADLPIYLLWGQDPTEDDIILPHLQQFANRLIFDSECSQSLRHFSQQILEHLHFQNLDVTDLNWARISGWRDVMAQAFDSPTRIEQLRSARLLKIAYNNRSDDFFLFPETQAFYLQAWLASQMNWEFERLERQEEMTILYYRFQQESIRILLQPLMREDLPPEEIMEVEVSDQANYLFSLTLQGDNQVVVHISTPEQCELPFTIFLPNIRSGRSFIQQIFYQKTSEQYFGMLRLVKHIEEKSA